MKLGLSYLVLCAGAKLLAVLENSIPLTAATPFVLLWQDIIAAVVLICVIQLSRAAGWIIYGLLCVHLAACLPMLRLMATPLTRPLLDAAGSTLSDSISHYVRPDVLVAPVMAILLGLALPWIFRKVRPNRAILVLLLFSCVTGVFGTRRADVSGLHRNFVAALVRSYLEPSGNFSPLPWRPTERAHLSDISGKASGFNLLIVTLESTGSRFLKAYGGRDNLMPRLAQMANDGLVIENAYTTYPESIKGLYSVLGSRQPVSGLSEAGYPQVAPSLATVLRGRGYDTALFHSGRFMYLGMSELMRASGFETTHDAGDIGGERESSFGVDDDQTLAHLLNWIDRRKSKNTFFIHYLPITGHHPYNAPRGPAKITNDLSAYRNSLQYSDELLGQLVDGLRQRKLIENTLVVIYGDHGEAFGEHPGNFGHTLYLYEENVRVPLIFYAPGTIPSSRCHRITSLADLSPTICDLLAIPTPDTFQGRSLLKPVASPAAFVTEYSLHLTGIRDGRWKFIHEKESGFARLYDLSLDPLEKTNLARFQPEIVQIYKAQLFDGRNDPGNLALRSP